MRFSYTAYNLQSGVVKGQLDVDSEADARTEVSRLGYKLLRMAPPLALPSMDTLFPSLFKVSVGEQIRFFRQAATMLNSGGNLVHALDMLQSEARNRVMRRVLASVRKTLDEGGSFSSALAQHPGVFGSLFLSVVEVGEHTGKLGPALEQMAAILEQEHEAKQKFIRTMMYPVAIIGLSTITLGFLMAVALPPLLKVFDQLGAQVPFMTRAALGLMKGFRSNLLPLLLAIVVAVASFLILRKLPRWRAWQDQTLIHLPLIGSFAVSSNLAHFSRITATLLDAGVPLATALGLAVGSIKNQALRRAFLDAQESLLSGHGLATALRGCKLLPTLFIELVMIGEESNTLRRTLADAAKAYQKQLDQQLSTMLAVLEPMSTVVVGAIVGFIAFSMFVPIYSGLNAVK